MGNGIPCDGRAVHSALADDGVYRAPLPMTEISRTAYYKGIPDGGNWDDAPSKSLRVQSQQPALLRSCAWLKARVMVGNLTITWKRRTRWYGEWQDGTDVPLFEASENYEIDILSGTTVKRTLTAMTPSAVYSATDQVTDFGAAQSAVTVAVYQINAVIGRGQ
jgi:hypothetical protein